MEKWRYPPMLVTKADKLPVGPEWSYEPKLDGFRIMGELAVGQTLLITRRGADYTRRYPAVARALPEAFGGRRLVVDGEMVAFDKEGNIAFNLLNEANPNVIYYIFDLLEVHGVPIIGRPLSERREQLRQLYMPGQDRVQLVDSYDPTDYDLLVGVVRGMGLEGVVAKRFDSPYLPGKRTRKWLKYIIHPHEGWQH
jgi:bifunctional non-homologous end joining protein LigD